MAPAHTIVATETSTLKREGPVPVLCPSVSTTHLDHASNGVFNNNNDKNTINNNNNNNINNISTNNNNNNKNI